MEHLALPFPLPATKLPQSSLKYKSSGSPTLIKDTCNLVGRSPTVSIKKKRRLAGAKNNKTFAHKNAISVSSPGNPFWLMAIYARLTNTRENLPEHAAGEEIGEDFKTYAKGGWKTLELQKRKL